MTGFMENNRDKIARLTRDAERALQGEELDALRDAEVLARAKIHF